MTHPTTEPNIRERLARFMSKVMPEPNSGCWIWIGARRSDGYGSFWAESRPMGAHRWAYAHFVGISDHSLKIDHLCRQPWCVNPDHLELVSHRENVIRGVSPLAQSARKTHCKRGHEFTIENTYRPPNRNERHCRTCLRATSSRNAAKRKAARHAERHIRDGGK